MSLIYWFLKNAHHFVLPMLVVFNAISFYAYFAKKRAMRGDPSWQTNRFMRGFGIAVLCFGCVLGGILIAQF